MMIVRAITAGCRLTAVHPTNHLLNNDYGDIDLMAVVPSQCESLMVNKYAHKRLRNMIVGGAPLSAPLEKELLKMPWKTFATYGMTETCSHVALRPVGSDVYSALPEITFGVDHRGCLTIKSARLSLIYWPQMILWSYCRRKNSDGADVTTISLTVAVSNSIPSNLRPFLTDISSFL